MSSEAGTSTSTPDPPLTSVPILLPLLRAPPSAKHAAYPPLENLVPSGQVHPSRIVYRQEKLGIDWVATNHVFPGAYPRSHPASTSPPCQEYLHSEPAPLPRDGAQDEERRRRTRDLAEWQRRLRVHGNIANYYPPESEGGAGELARELAAKAFPQLWATAQRIVPISDRQSDPPNDSRPSYTLVLSHANGFHKETWEAMLPRLIDLLVNEVLIDEIWTLDTMGSGESGALNRTSLGETVSWFDGVRDLQQFLEHFVPPRKHSLSASAGPGWPPTVLPRRSGQGAKTRKFIGIGHSYSGSCFSMLAGTRPELLDGVVLVDPVIYHPDNFLTFAGTKYQGLNHPAATGAVVRRDVWPSREAAKAYFLSRPFFQVWHTDSLASYARFGLRPIVSATESWVTLSTSKWTEAALFAAHMGVWALAALRFGSFKGKIHHFYMQQTVQSSQDTDAINDAIARFGGRSEELPGGHLVVQEQPELIGRKIAEALRRMFGVSTASLAQPRL